MAGWTQRRRGMHPSAELMDRSWSYSDLNQIHSDDPGSQKSSLAGWQVYSADVYSLTSSGFTCCTHLKKDAAASHFPPLPFIFLHVNILGDAEVDLFKVEGKTVQENSFFLYSSLHFCPLKSPLCVFLQSSVRFLHCSSLPSKGSVLGHLSSSHHSILRIYHKTLCFLSKMHQCYKMSTGTSLWCVDHN